MPQLDDLDVIIRRKNATTVVAIVPQASLYATGATVEAAFEALEQKRNELKAEMAAAGEADDFDAPPASGRATASGGTTRDLWTFAAKACIAAVLAAVALDYVGSSTQTRIEEVTEKVRRSLDTGALRGGSSILDPDRAGPRTTGRSAQRPARGQEGKAARRPARRRRPLEAVRRGGVQAVCDRRRP